LCHGNHLAQHSTTQHNMSQNGNVAEIISSLVSSALTGLGAANVGVDMNIGIGMNMDMDGEEGAARHASQQVLDALRPLKLAEIRHSQPEGETTGADADADADPLICPICYDPYVEYDPKGTVIRETSSDTLVASETVPQVGTGTPFNGYDAQDPSIMFPAVETATYVQSYTMAVDTGVGVVETTTSQTTPSLASAPATASADPHYAVQLPQCNHIFGRPCIVEWLRSHVSCPLCRREVEGTTTMNTGAGAGTGADTNSPRVYVYDRAITETFVPVDWTCPPSAGGWMQDPPLTMPVPGLGMATGHRTGRQEQ
jgi:hypothetical protein